jgi:hypothetical protein
MWTYLVEYFASSANIGEITTQSIRTDNIHITGIPTTYSQIVIQATANYDASQYALLSKGFIFVQTIVDTILHLSTADTAAEATRLLTLFDITDLTTTRLLKVTRVSDTASAHTITLGNDFTNTTSTANHIQFSKGGTAPSGTTILIAASGSTRDSIILVSKVAAISPGTGDAILFDVICQA